MKSRSTEGNSLMFRCTQKVWSKQN